MNLTPSIVHAVVVLIAATVGLFMGFPIVAAFLAVCYYYVRELYQFYIKHGRLEWLPWYWNKQFQYDFYYPVAAFLFVVLASLAWSYTL